MERRSFLKTIGSGLAGLSLDQVVNAQSERITFEQAKAGSDELKQQYINQLVREKFPEAYEFVDRFVFDSSGDATLVSTTLERLGLVKKDYYVDRFLRRLEIDPSTVPNSKDLVTALSFEDGGFAQKYLRSEAITTCESGEYGRERKSSIHVSNIPFDGKFVGSEGKISHIPTSEEDLTLTLKHEISHAKLNHSLSYNGEKIMSEENYSLLELMDGGYGLIFREGIPIIETVDYAKEKFGLDSEVYRRQKDDLRETKKLLDELNSFAGIDPKFAAPKGYESAWARLSKHMDEAAKRHDLN